MQKREFLIGALWVALSFQGAAAQTLESLIEGGHYQQAYELALPQLGQRAGESGFDFMFGMAAIESGQPQEALFAFERVLAAQPWDHRARLELARAHFMLGNFDQARRLFETVLATHPPQRVRDNIQRFLDQLDSRNQQRDRQFSASAELSFGMDSNINSATEVESVALPIIGQVLTLSETSREIADEFYELAVNASYLKLLRKDSGLFAALSLSDHQNVSYNQFDIRATGATFGYIRKRGNDSLRLPLQWQMVEVARTRFRTSTGLGLEWSRSRPGAGQLALFGQWARQRHNDSEALRDADLLLAGAAWSLEAAALRSRLSVSAYFASEQAVDNQYDYFSRSYPGLRLAVQWQLQPQHGLELALARQSSGYGAVHPLFGLQREDGYSQMSLAWRWSIDSHWSAGLTLSSSRNDSNIEIYSYDRTQHYFTLGYAL